MKILVAGGGIVGCTLALALAQRGEEVELIEARTPDLDPDTTVPDARVTAIRPRSQAWLEALGVWAANGGAEHTASPAACYYRRVEIVDADGTGGLSFDADESGYEHLGAIVENRLLLRALWDRLSAQDNVRIRCPAELRGLRNAPSSSQHALALQVDDEWLQAELIVAADGARSRLRQWAELPASERAYDQTTIVVPVRCERPHGACARQSFTDRGPLALLPLARDAHQCALLWSLDTPAAEQYRQQPVTALTAAASQRSGLGVGAIDPLSEPVYFPLYERTVASYWCDGLVLVGDAAHSVHPLAGLGLNMGLDDCAALVQELAATDNLYLALERYQSRRARDNRGLALGVRSLQQLFGNGFPPLRLLRNLGMRALNRTPAAKRLLLAAALGILPPPSRPETPERVG